MRSYTGTLCLALLVLATACADRTGPNPASSDTPSFLATSCSLGLSEEEVRAVIADLMDQVDALEAAGALSSGQAGALRNHLRNALRALDDGNLCPAVAQLQAFRDQVSDFVADGALSEGEATPLLDEADRALGETPLIVEATVTAGELHSCGLTASGTAYCWGSNSSGQLGDGTTTDRTSPVQVSGALAFITLSAGGAHTCGLSTAGQAYCWGGNAFGELGDGTTTNRTTPVPVTGGLTLAAISAGGLHTCGLSTGGQAYCWGDNEFGRLGDGTFTHQTSPVAVAGAFIFARISAGTEHTCGLSTAGQAYCWGFNLDGQVGDGCTSFDCPSPVLVTGGLTFATITAGGGHTCGLSAAGQAYCWGRNLEGQLGNGSFGSSETSPVTVAGGFTFAEISAGGAHTCGLSTGGQAYCWGDNEFGRLGDGSTTLDFTISPVLVTGGLTFATISAGGLHTCGLSTAGPYCWGRNNHGQLGDGTTTDRTSPVAVLGWSTLP